MSLDVNPMSQSVNIVGMNDQDLLGPDMNNNGSMFIRFEAGSLSHPIDRPIRGSIMVNLKNPIKGMSLTLTLCG